jgi:superfamily II DNA or RNA helicase
MVKDYTLKNKQNIVLTQDQNEVVEALINNPRFFNCSQTGFGKTITTITAAVYHYMNNLEEGKDFDYVIVCPTVANRAFINLFQNIFAIPYNIYTAQNFKEMKDAKFHIFNYSTLTGNLIKKKKVVNNVPLVEWVDNLQTATPYIEKLTELYKRNPNLHLILDEAHALQDFKSSQYIVMNSLAPLFKGIWALTATPVLNDIEGVFYMTELVKPQHFKNIYRFRNKYVKTQDVEFWHYNRKTRRRELVKRKQAIGTQNEDELRREFGEISIIKAKQYNLDFQYRETSMTDEDAKFYKLAADGLFKDDSKEHKSKGKGDKSDYGARLHDLQRVVSNSHPNFTQDKDITEKEILLIKTIKEIIDRNEGTLVYFSYLDTMRRVESIVKKYQRELGIVNLSSISGSTDQKTRSKISKELDRKHVVFITSAGTESIDLEKVNNIIFYEIPFPIREFIQAAGRITRTNTKYGKQTIYILEVKNTIDTYKKLRIQSHIGIISGILGGTNTLPIEMINLDYDDRESMKKDLLWWK